MIGQQREILTSLGIDVWIPRTAVSENLAQSRIWRDQVNAIEVVEVAPVTIAAAPEVMLEPQPVPEPVVVEPVERNAEINIQQHESVLPELAQFQLQLLSLAHCTICIDATHLSSMQQQLWHNISAAVEAELHVLQWPFPLLNLQDTRGIKSYIQGFLDAHSLDKTLISLGQLAYSPKPMQHLPSLQQMLDEPQCKRILWNALQQKTVKE